MSVPLGDIIGGGRYWSPEEIGEKVSGTITLVERRQQTAFGSGEPLTWPDGRPRLLTYIELQTNQRDDDDDGVRALYAKGGKYDIKSGSGAALEVAIGEAAKAAGATTLEEGATLSVAFTGIAKPTQPGLQSAKLYTAKYEPPVSKVAVDDLWDE